MPWYWVSFPATYNMAHFRKAGLEPPKTWDELLKQGKVLKKQGNPIGIAISHTGDANTTFWAVLWGFGGKVLEADGKTPAIVSDKTARGHRVVQGGSTGTRWSPRSSPGTTPPTTAASSPASWLLDPQPDQPV